MKKPVRVTVTGAAGQIGYSLLFRIASGEMLGTDQPVILHLLDIPASMPALQGVAMELDDCAFPLLQGLVLTDDPITGFRDTDIALLVGARPRGPGMERKDLLESNGAIFTTQGRALNDVASRDVKVLVVGNPANTNALIAMNHAPDLPRKNFTAMMRLDHNRARTQLAKQAKAATTDVTQVIVWGNHSATQYPDYHHTLIKGQPAPSVINDQAWYTDTFIPTVQQRGAAIIKARGLSSAASAANAAIDHVRNWVLGTPSDDWVSMGIPSDGSYGIPEGVIFGYPVRCKDGNYEIVQGLEISAFSRTRIDATHKELQEERAAIAHLLK